jgi:tripartite-type tricarboxylate transporter receptor subunit TctC
VGGSLSLAESQPRTDGKRSLPAGTPAAIVDKLNAAANAALRSGEMKASMEKLGIEATIGSPQDFAAFIADEAPKWTRIVEASGVKTE